MADEIIKELWQIKDRIAYEHGYDLDVLIAYLRSRKHIGTHQIVDLRSMKETAEQSHAP